MLSNHPEVVVAILLLDDPVVREKDDAQFKSVATLGNDATSSTPDQESRRKVYDASFELCNTHNDSMVC
jgi:hypothetical protein